MKARISAGKAYGCVRVPPSKSMAHRGLICAAFADGESTIRGISNCEDVRATLDCLRAIGVDCKQNGDTVSIRGVDIQKALPNEILNCRESGSTLRFLIPSLLLCGSPATFSGYGRLMERPMQIYEDICSEKGLRFEKKERELTVCGPLPSGRYTLAGNVSSQFVSGLLFALPMAEGDSVIELTTMPESRSYILMTLDAMQQFGVQVAYDGNTRFCIKGGQRYCKRDWTVEGDYSNAAFLDALNGLGGDVKLEGLLENSLQGDRVYQTAMAVLDGKQAEISLADCPDLGPILFAYAAAKHGGIFTDTERLRIKESDRVATMQQELAKLGVKMRVSENRVEIEKGEFHAPATAICGHNDHRIVMSMAILLTKTGGEIEGAEAVKKSYPAFFDDLRRLGICLTEDMNA